VLDRINERLASLALPPSITSPTSVEARALEPDGLDSSPSTPTEEELPTAASVAQGPSTSNNSDSVIGSHANLALSEYNDDDIYALDVDITDFDSPRSSLPLITIPLRAGNVGILSDIQESLHAIQPSGRRYGDSLPGSPGQYPLEELAQPSLQSGLGLSLWSSPSADRLGQDTDASHLEGVTVQSLQSLDDQNDGAGDWDSNYDEENRSTTFKSESSEVGDLEIELVTIDCSFVGAPYPEGFNYRVDELASDFSVFQPPVFSEEASPAGCSRIRLPPCSELWRIADGASMQCSALDRYMHAAARRIIC
jgi:hypothetical protein